MVRAMCTLCRDSCWGSEADSSREEVMRVFGGVRARAGQFVGVSVGVKELERHVWPGDLEDRINCQR